jgi:hypothetical protein
MVSILWRAAMSIAESRHDSRWRLLIVYDHHQPSARPHIALEEPLTVGPVVGCPMVGHLHSVENLL